MRIALSSALAVAVMLGATVAESGRVPSLAPRAILLRIEGHVGPPRDGDRRIAELRLRRKDATFTFQVSEIWVLSGDAAGQDILHEVEPYTPSMSVFGPPEVVGKLVNASSDQPLEVTGYFRRGQRILTLSSVEPAKK